MISMGMGDDHEANRFPGGLLDFLENGFARRRIAPRVDRDDFVSQREPARVGALVRELGDRELPELGTAAAPPVEPPGVRVLMQLPYVARKRPEKAPRVREGASDEPGAGCRSPRRC